MKRCCMKNQGDNYVTNPNVSGETDSFDTVCEKRFSRRSFVKSTLALGVGAAVLNLSGCGDSEQENEELLNNQWKDNNPYRSSFDFIEIEHGVDEHHHVAPDHKAKV